MCHYVIISTRTILPRRVGWIPCEHSDEARFQLLTGAQSSLINRAHSSDELGDNRHSIVQRHGPALMRSLLLGFAGSAPKSTVANLGELFNTLITKYPGESRTWMTQVLYGVRHVACGE